MIDTVNILFFDMVNILTKEFDFEIAAIEMVLHILFVINFAKLIKIQTSINTIYLRIKAKFSGKFW